MMSELFAGVWPLVAHYGIFAGGIGAALAFAYFSPVFKKTALWVAAGIAVGVTCYDLGVRDGERRVYAKWNAAVQNTVRKVDDARRGAVDDVRRSGVPNHTKWDRDRH